MSDKSETQTVQLEEPRSYYEILKDTTLENSYLIWLCAALTFGFFTFLTVISLIHIHITEVHILALGEQSSGKSLLDNPMWGYYLNLAIFGMTTVACFKCYLDNRGETGV